MKKEILHKYGEDDIGNITHISKISTNTDYYCPDCKEKFIFKRGMIRQHHFSHRNETSNCTGEGYLHKMFKKLSLQKIKGHLQSNLPLNVEWVCNFCKQKHRGNLLNGIFDAKDEHSLGPCRPDITLLNRDSKASVVIEIIDTHEPEEGALKHYIDNRIILIRIKLDSMDDLENHEKKLESPTSIANYSFASCPNYRPQRRIVGFVPVVDVDAIRRRVMAERSRRRF